MAAREQVDAGAAEEAFHVAVSCLGQQDVVVGVRRAVERAERQPSFELDIEGGEKGADLLEVARLEPAERPLAALELRLGDRLGRVGRHLEQERVGVAEDHRPAEPGEPVEHLGRLRAALRDVAETDDLTDAEPLELSDDHRKRGVVAVNVRDERDGHPLYDMQTMSVRVRMAPSPTGALHLGGVRTALFNWLFARNRGGEFLVRIENTDTSREVQGAVEHALESLAWLGLDWDRPPTFQLDRLDDCRRVAEQLVVEGKAYEDEGAIRFRMPDEGTTSWNDAVRGEISFPNESLEDLVLVRADGRPTYNFASPMEDVWDGITHVIRGEDHVSNTPKQINIIRAVGAEPPVYAHVPNVMGPDGKKLSKRHGATGVDELRAQGYYAPALMNFLALLGWAPDGETTIMSRDDLIERFSLERVSPSTAQFDYDKLDWMNGVYLRALPPGEYADLLVAYLREQGYDWEEERIRAAAPLVQEKIAKLGEFPEFAGFLFHDVQVEAGSDGEVVEAARDALAELEPFTAEAIEASLRAVVEQLGLKPRQGFQPIRVAVTGSRVSPGLFESIELLGRETTLERLSAAS